MLWKKNMKHYLKILLLLFLFVNCTHVNDISKKKSHVGISHTAVRVILFWKFEGTLSACSLIQSITLCKRNQKVHHCYNLTYDPILSCFNPVHIKFAWLSETVIMTCILLLSSHDLAHSFFSGVFFASHYSPLDSQHFKYFPSTEVHPNIIESVPVVLI
jgi:hypothetical protein